MDMTTVKAAPTSYALNPTATNFTPTTQSDGSSDLISFSRPPSPTTSSEQRLGNAIRTSPLDADLNAMLDRVYPYKTVSKVYRDKAHEYATVSASVRHEVIKTIKGHLAALANKAQSRGWYEEKAALTQIRKDLKMIVEDLSSANSPLI